MTMIQTSPDIQSSDHPMHCCHRASTVLNTVLRAHEKHLCPLLVAWICEKRDGFTLENPRKMVLLRQNMKHGGCHIVLHQVWPSWTGDGRHEKINSPRNKLCIQYLFIREICSI